MAETNLYKKLTLSVSFQQWLRLFLAYMLIPIVLFISAGNLSWWQGWGYSILIVVIGVGGRLWADIQNPGLTAQRQNRENLKNAKAWDKVLAPLMAVSLSYFMVIFAGLDYRYGGSVAFPIWVNIFGFLLIAFGYAFASWAVVANRFFFSVVIIRSDEGHRVCDTGPYRFVRHPGYAGNILQLFGMVLALNSLWTLLPAVLALVIMFIRTSLEDKTLHEELLGYKDYAERVRYKLVPGIY